MTILTLDRKELERKVGKISKEVEEKITEMGAPVEGITETEVSVEVFPNRPDLLSAEGFTRALLHFLGKKKRTGYKTEKPLKDYVVKIDKSVKKVRPYTACAIVRNLKLDDQKIKEIIDIQEKLHLTIGRKRKKLAIGIYPLEKISLPITFKAEKPDRIRFQPLEFPKEITGAQILRDHPTGRDYADLLKGAELYPIFVDGGDKILSMPPIINSHETGKIDENTKEVFIECSGFNLVHLKKCLSIVVCAMADMGGKIYSMKIEDGKESFVSPNIKGEELEFRVEDINKTLGMNFDENEIKKYLEKMGLGFTKKGKKCFASIPAYRADILHWVDLTEEIAIAHGYKNFSPEIPDISTIAEEDQSAVKKRHISEILAGLGLIECSSFHLAVKQDVKKMHYEFKDFIEIEDSKTEYNVLRMDLLSNLMRVLSENSDSQYPQKVFEVGRIFETDKEEKTETGIREKNRLGIVLAGEKTDFTEVKQVLDYLFKMLDVKYEIKETENNNFIPGRVGEVFVNGKSMGFIGELAPRVLKNWKVYMPVVALEIDLDFVI